MTLDFFNYRVRRVDALTGIITTVAGGGYLSPADGLLATSVSLPWPGVSDVVPDAQGNLFFAVGRQDRIYRVDAVNGTLSIVASGFADPISMTIDSGGNLYVADNFQGRVARIDRDTRAVTDVVSGFAAPTGLALDGQGNLYFSERDGHRVYRMNLTSGLTTIVAGTCVAGFSGDGGLATTAQIWLPFGVALDAAGNLFISDLGNCRIRRVDAQSGIMTTFAGTGVSQPYVPAGSPFAVNFRVAGLRFDGAGNLYLTDLENHAIRRMSMLDSTAPATSYQVSQAPTVFGWNNTAVTVMLSATDNPGGSGVKQIQWSLAGAERSAVSTVAGSVAWVKISAEGTTTLAYFATDNTGNVEIVKTLVLNIDKTPPAISCAASPSTIWPPNKEMVPVTVSVNVADSVSGPNGLVLVSATSNEPEAGSIQGFAPGTQSTSGSLKADRLGPGSGRVYSLVYQGHDRAGNTANCTATVTVPHDLGK